MQKLNRHDIKQKSMRLNAQHSRSLLFAYAHAEAGVMHLTTRQQRRLTGLRFG
jgi:hypothetical protein